MITQISGHAGCYTSPKSRILTPPPEWDFTSPRFKSAPGAICPDCDGYGCGNCGYRGTRAEDLCGQRQLVENLLRFRFGTVDEELARVIDSLLQLSPDDFARILLELPSLSREELLVRFVSHG